HSVGRRHLVGDPDDVAGLRLLVADGVVSRFLHCLRQARSVCARELATKLQSNFALKRRSNPSLLAGRDGLLRGACHRARIRATRWLAMTVMVRCQAHTKRKTRGAPRVFVSP